MSASQNLTYLKTRRSAVALELSNLSTSTAGGSPNTDGPGINVDHTDYKRSLYEELESLDKLIKDAEDAVASEAGNIGIHVTRLH